MADQDDGAGIIRQQFLQQFQRLQIEIVGGFVQHQQIGLLGQRHSQRHAAALAAGQHADLGAGLFRAEQKILHIADDMAALAPDINGLAMPARQRVRQGGCRVEAGAALVEADHLQ